VIAPSTKSPHSNTHSPRQNQWSRRQSSSSHHHPQHWSHHNWTSDPRIQRQLNWRRSPIATSPIVTNGPITPELAIDRYVHFLTTYECSEIFGFPDIYFVGNRDNKIDPEPDDDYFFDDDSDNYRLIVGDHLAYRYEVLSLFGAGAFGEVARCFDHKLKREVAVKVIVNTEQMHEQGQIEIQILSSLASKPHRHIVRPFDAFVFRSHVCISFEVLAMNLFEYCQSNEFCPVPSRFVRLYGLQLFSALAHVHRIGAIHCDIKPENILLESGSTTRVKLIDFGSGCFVGQAKYEYIQSRFYRAPEVLIGLSYGPPMDVWSAALVLAELMAGHPLFPGDDEDEQIEMIMELLGEPDVELFEQARRQEHFFEADGRFVRTSLRVPGSLNLKEILQTNDEVVIDFLMKCLTWDQEKRMTAVQALNHPWMKVREVCQPRLPGLRR
jgi:dual specificity tyrosine-phosphorylation-regulated kinase 2/3/4